MCALIDADDLADLEDTRAAADDAHAGRARDGPRASRSPASARSRRSATTPSPRGRRCVAGRSGVGRINTFDAETFPVQIAGHGQGLRPRRAAAATPARARHLSRAAGFGVAAALEALADAGARGRAPTSRASAASRWRGSVGRPDLQELVDMSHAIKSSEGRAAPAPGAVERARARPERGRCDASALLGDAEGPMFSVSTACTASAHAIGEAFRRIQEGDAKVMLAGGYDALTTWFDVIGFGLLGALTKDHADEPERASRPVRRGALRLRARRGRGVAVLEDARVRARARRARSTPRSRATARA